GRRSEVGRRRSEVGGRTSEVGRRRSEVGGRRSDVRRRRSDVKAIFVAALVLFVVASTELHAQSRADTLLPDLAPREVEILGDLEIAFPSLRRQPLTGFNPPPRIFQVPRGRRPYAGEYKQESASLPGSSLIRPATPPATISVGQNPQQGEFIVGVGSYLSREIRGVAAFDLSKAVRANIDLLHDGYDTFKPFSDSANADVEAPFRNFDGTAGIEYNLGASTLGIDLSGFSRKYNMYGLQPDTSTSNRPDRDGQGFELAGIYEGGSTTALPFVIEASLGSDRYKTTTAGDLVEIESKESLFDVAGETRVKISSRDVRLDGAIGRRSLDDGIDPSTNVMGYDLGGDLVLNIGAKSTLRLGAQVQGYSSSKGHVGDSLESSKLYIAPRIEYRNPIAPGLEIYAANTPVARHTSQRGIYQINPFVGDGPLVLPELSAINLEAGIVYYTGPLRLSARGGYAMYENYLFFDPDSSRLGAFSGIIYDAQYGNVDTYLFGGDVSLAFPGSFSLGVTADWKGATLDTDQEVPYFPNFESGIRATYTFAEDRAIVQADGKYIGTRFTDRGGTNELSGYLDLSALASYYVTPRIGIYVRAKSITGERFERWVGYPAANWIVMGGVRLRW
ncbi:MAG: TonB-dependent receptor, partial [Rhodothermia bacterium]